MKGITLIGMPGAGKSVIGKQLANQLGWNFIDLDILLKEKEGKDLIEIIREKGEREFVELETKYALELTLANTVFSPGGSIVYSPRAMEKLNSETNIIYLDVPFEEIKNRLAGDLETRGIIGLALNGLDNLFKERVLLYQNFSHHTISCAGSSEKEIINQIYNFSKLFSSS